MLYVWGTDNTKFPTIPPKNNSLLRIWHVEETSWLGRSPSAGPHPQYYHSKLQGHAGLELSLPSSCSQICWLKGTSQTPRLSSASPLRHWLLFTLLGESRNRPFIRCLWRGKVVRFRLGFWVRAQHAQSPWPWGHPLWPALSRNTSFLSETSWFLECTQSKSCRRCCSLSICREEGGSWLGRKQVLEADSWTSVTLSLSSPKVEKTLRPDSKFAVRSNESTKGFAECLARSQQPRLVSIICPQWLLRSPLLEKTVLSHNLAQRSGSQLPTDTVTVMHLDSVIEIELRQEEGKGK